MPKKTPAAKALTKLRNLSLRYLGLDAEYAVGDYLDSFVTKGEVRDELRVRRTMALREIATINKVLEILTDRPAGYVTEAEAE
jgi:hypothetical protein